VAAPFTTGLELIAPAMEVLKPNAELTHPRTEPGSFEFSVAVESTKLTTAPVIDFTSVASTDIFPPVIL
jgi:hypothetical protein